MRLSEQLKVIRNASRIRIIKGRRGNRDPEDDPGVKILYSGIKILLEYAESKEYLARNPADKKTLEDIEIYLKEDPAVNELTATLEVRHRQHKELGLMPPYEPDITRKYEFADLTILQYYDIYI